MTGFALKMCGSNKRWNFFQPLTFSLNLKCHLNPWFQIEVRFVGESLLFNLSFHYVLELYHFLRTVIRQFQVINHLFHINQK